MKYEVTAPKVLGTLTLILAGYIFVISLPDLVRYIKISTM